MSAIKDSHAQDPKRGTHGDYESHIAGVKIASDTIDEPSTSRSETRRVQPPEVSGGRCLLGTHTLALRHVVGCLSKAERKGDI